MDKYVNNTKLVIITVLGIIAFMMLIDIIVMEMKM